jgi:hypothetical protein
MTRFELSDAAIKLKDRYLAADDFRTVILKLDKRETFAVVQQWMTEGIPYIFTEAPLLYEAMRSWLAMRLELNAKELTLIGSGRLGFSFKVTRFGEFFSQRSDLDFTAVSSHLFDGGKSSFNHWKEDYQVGRVQPRNSTEEAYWKQNLLGVPSSIARGFIDPHFLPNRYEWPKRISQSLYLLQGKINLTPSAPKVRKVSIRVYSDWAAFVKQMQLNLFTTLMQLS